MNISSFIYNDDLILLFLERISNAAPDDLGMNELTCKSEEFVVVVVACYNLVVTKVENCLPFNNTLAQHSYVMMTSRGSHVTTNQPELRTGGS